MGGGCDVHMWDVDLGNVITWFSFADSLRIASSRGLFSSVCLLQINECCKLVWFKHVNLSLFLTFT